MTFNTPAALNAIVNLVSGLPSLQGLALKGAPANLDYKVTAFVACGGQAPKDKAAGLRQRAMNFWVMFAYRTGGDVATAENTIAALLDEFETALYADRTLGGVVESVEADFSSADSPDYRTVAGHEYREYPVIVTVKQSRNYP